MLSFDRVTYTYPGARSHALDDVSFQIHSGEFCLLAGLSGQGKSTLLRAACGLVPHFHGGRFAGTVRLAGLDTRDHGPAELGAFAGALFQDPETQLVTNSVRAELSLTLESRGHSAPAIARGVEEVALALGIDALLDRSVHDLSGGEQQRVALGAALAGRPQVILLDEPTSQLDPVAGDELIGLLRRLNQEWEMTILLAEHRLERCLSIADRVIAMHRGGVAHDGDPASFLTWAAARAPALQTPGAKLFSLAGLQPPPIGVRQARSELRRRGLLSDDLGGDAPSAPHVDRRSPEGRPGRERRQHAALSLKGVWHELPSGPAILRGVTLRVLPGEAVALMGRNGAGKSTLLRHAAGLLEPTRGKIESAGRIALMLQNPGDYLLHGRVADEASPSVLERAGLAGLSQRDPRDLSGGERQRLALAIVSGHGLPESAGGAVLLALDEPTRGMDRAAKASLAEDLRARARAGQAVIVATHDPEFAAACATRCLLLADGRVIADGPTSELLAGGWYFSTETARILGPGAGALTPDEGALLLLAETSSNDGRTGAITPGHAVGQPVR